MSHGFTSATCVVSTCLLPQILLQLLGDVHERGVHEAALLCHCSYSSAHCRINMKRTSGDKSGASPGGFLANLSGEQQSAGKPALISLAPPPPPQVRHWHLGSLYPADSSFCEMEIYLHERVFVCDMSSTCMHTHPVSPYIRAGMWCQVAYLA